MNKIYKIILIGIVFFASSLSLSFAQNSNPYNIPDCPPHLPDCHPSRSDESIIPRIPIEEPDNSTENSDTIINQLLQIFGFDTANKYSGPLKFIIYVRSIINVALGLLSFITLIMIIYTFYMMFFTDHDAGIKKAKGNLLGLFLALAIIGLAWIITSFIFWLYQSIWLDKQELIDQKGNISYNYSNDLTQHHKIRL